MRGVRTGGACWGWGFGGEEEGRDCCDAGLGGGLVIELQWIDIGRVGGWWVTLTMMEMYNTISGISEGLVAHIESTSCPIAAPRGFARLATAVALVRPRSENQSSLYRVGAQRQKGCAKPMRIWPNIASPKIPPFAFVPAYLSQLPTSSRAAVTTMACFGPPLFKIQMTRLYCGQIRSGLLKSGIHSLILTG